jgi:predicted RNA-binding protein YlxR (DUF448 family)
MSKSEITGIGNKQEARTQLLPQRSCVGCRQVRDKRQLIRLVRLGNGEVEVDITGKKSGRGAYICPSPSCWQEGLKKNRLERALRTSITKEERQRLLEHGQSLANEEITGAAS